MSVITCVTSIHVTARHGTRGPGFKHAMCNQLLQLLVAAQHNICLEQPLSLQASVSSKPIM